MRGPMSTSASQRRRGGDCALGEDRLRIEIEAPVHEGRTRVEAAQRGGDEGRERRVGPDHDRVEAAERAQAPGGGAQHERAVPESFQRARLAPRGAEHALDRDPVPALGARQAGPRILPGAVAGERGDLPPPTALLDREVAEHPRADDVVGVEEVVVDEEAGH
jgi:hypothetical protein